MTDISKRGLVRRLAVLLVLGLLVVSTATLIRGGDTTINATFTSAEGLYVGDDVRVLGVPVGTVSQITPSETGVEVELIIEDGITDAKRLREIYRMFFSVLSMVAAPAI